MIIKNIYTTLGAEDLNPMAIVWDMDFDSENENNRWVDKIHSVNIALFDKQDVNVTENFSGGYYSQNLRSRLETELLEAVEYESIEDLIAEFDNPKTLSHAE